MKSITNITYKIDDSFYQYGLSVEKYEIDGNVIKGVCRNGDEVQVEFKKIIEIKTTEYICPVGPSFSAYIKSVEGFGLSPYGNWHIGDDENKHSWFFHQHTVRDGHNGEDLVVSYEKELLR